MIHYLKEAEKKTFTKDSETVRMVGDIIDRVIRYGDQEIKELSLKFDGIKTERIRVSEEEIKAAYDQVETRTLEAMKFAADQIRFYAEKQMECLKPLDRVSQIEGVVLSHKLVPVDSVGIYVPGGRYPLPSTALMLAIPARVAGVKRIAACSPPSKTSGNLHPAILVAMDIAGVDEIYKTGGAQAIAALTYGTESVRKVDLIAGPGNRFVTEAKRQVIGEVGIDSLAGPSEVLIIADETADPDFVAIDLLAQCEHDPNARATLATTSRKLAEMVPEKIALFARELPTGAISAQSWEDNGIIILTDSLEEAVEIANEMAPEHLEVQAADGDRIADRLLHFGSLFVGHYAPVTFGDYCSGTNHTLPTMRTARYSNGVWVGTFMKTAFVQHVSGQGCKNLADHCIHLADAEGLAAHKKSVEVRISKILHSSGC